MRILLLLLLFLSLAVTLAAQVKNDKDVQIIDFGADDSGSSGPLSYSGFIIKTSPVSFLFGHQTVEVEKEMNDFLSLQGGLGITFTSLVNAAIFSEGTDLELDGFAHRFSFSESEQWPQDITDYYYELDYRRVKPGFRLAFSARLFFDNDGFEGSYLSPAFTYSRYNYEVQNVANSTGQEVVRLENQWIQEYENITDLTIRYGYTELFPRLAMDYFAGIGVRFLKGRRQDLGRDIFGRTGSKIREVDELGLLLEAGIRVGFQL